MTISESQLATMIMYNFMTKEKVNCTLSRTTGINLDLWVWNRHFVRAFVERNTVNPFILIFKHYKTDINIITYKYYMNITIKKRTFLHPSVINLPSNAPKEKEPFFMPWKREPVKKTPIKQTEAYNPTQNIWDFLMFLSCTFLCCRTSCRTTGFCSPFKSQILRF